MDIIIPFAPLVATLAGWIIVLSFAHWLLLARHPDLGNEGKFPRQLIMLALTVTAIVSATLVLPISDSSRNQILGIIGLIISGVVAFSSTTIVSNLMAGLLLRISKPFRMGDFIRVGEHFGRVSDRGLFDTEIQTESRELVSLPNTYFINNPVTTTRSSGTLISHTLSLGYEQHHSIIEPLLKKAAEDSGLTDPFVQITTLGDFSISYRVAGLLIEVKELLSARSNLCRHILDELHSAGVEIVSPNFMNQRQLNPVEKAIPKDIPSADEKPTEEKITKADEIAFDKAEQAEKFESRREKLKNDIKELEASLKEASKEDSEAIKKHILAKNKLLLALAKSETAHKASP